jgi:protein-S-isoprenylcysteine O-methyltransferase Ste14
VGVAGYLGLGGFFVAEALVRQRGAASSLDASSADRASTCVLVGASAVAACLPALIRNAPSHSLPGVVAPMGLALEGAGLTVRVWSMQTLGANYSRTLRADARQQVVDRGPYRWIRHPGYLGSLLVWMGFALTSRKLPVVLAVLALMGGAYRHRILAEESLLRRELPGYTAYTSRTKRLIPFAW